uniref:Uncharacterized protein n=1 Tax=Angiostrongylus cantonensis TaxID=6313 RepID=A0A0K0DF99_ANGCA
MRVNDNRWTRAVSYWIPRDVKRTAGRPPTRWSEFFTKNLEERYDARRVPEARRTHWAALARDSEKWRTYWRPLESLDDQRDYRCESIPALAIFVIYALTSNYGEEEVEAFYMDLDKFYGEDHTFFIFINRDLSAMIGLKATSEEHHIETRGLEWSG